MEPVQTPEMLVGCAKPVKQPYQYEDDMLVFKGKLFFNPSSLNNEIVVYFLAHALQKDPTYSYDRWESLINKVGKLYRDYNVAIPVDRKNPKPDLKLFNDWSVYGDGTTFPDYNVVAVYDSAKSEPFIQDPTKAVEIGKKLTTEVGLHKGNIADIDTDSQQMSKWFGNSLVLMDSISLSLQPVCFSNMTQRVLNKGPSNPTFQADWYTNQSNAAQKDHGQSVSSFPILERMFNKVNEQGSDYKFAFRAAQYHYNTTSKESQIVGFLELINTKLEPVQTAQWRALSSLQRVKDQDLATSCIWFKQTKKGVLMDLASIMKDMHLEGGLLEYPETITITELPWNKLIQITDCEKLIEERGGLIFFPGQTLPANRPISVNSQIKFSFAPNPKLSPQPSRFEEVWKLKEHEFAPAVVDRFLKSPVLDFAKETYSTHIKYDIFCTKFGNPYTGKRTFTLTSRNDGDLSGVDNYLDLKGVRDRIQNLIEKSKDEAYAQKTVDQIIQEYYGGQEILDKIISVAQYTKKIHSDGEKLEAAYLLPDAKFPTEIWRVRPLNHREIQGKVHLEIHFQQGKGTFSVQTNHPFTAVTNPRREVFDSLCLIGVLEDDGGASTDFTALFFQNPATEKQAEDNDREKQILSQKNNKKKSKKEGVDWVNFVGPRLRVMAMMYPAMQRLANLYQLKVTMGAMKRVFSIEDELNPRYMPSTREMSPIEHRKIWKWLYSGLYNNSTLNAGWHVTKKPWILGSSAPEDRQTVKGKLIGKLHDAFKLEFGTIPLYLSGMYSVTPGGYTEQVFRSILMDEMKHLCIVSNLINALGGKPDYKSNIPSYPCNLPQVFQEAKNHKLGEKINVGPCTPDQVKKLIMIEYPTEVENIQLILDGLSAGSQKRMKELKDYLNEVLYEIDNNDQFKTIGMFYEEIIEDLWRLYDLYKEDPHNLWKGDTRRQFTYFMEGLSPIYDLKTALDQIRLIVEEGEGSHVFDLTGDINKKSHFFKLIEIYTGCRAVAVQNTIPGGQIHKQQFQLHFTDLGVPYEMSDIASEWEDKQVEKVREEINQEIQLDTIAPTKYPNLYAHPAFQGVFRGMISDLHETFTDDPSDNVKDSQSYDSKQLKKFENAVAKMKQMSMLARQLLRPNSEQVGYGPITGVPPNFNIDKKENHQKE